MVGAPLEGEEAKCAGGVLGAPFFFKACNPLLTCSRLKHLISTNQQLPHKSLLVHETGGLGHSLAPRPAHISDLGTSRASPVVSSSSLIANNLHSPAKKKYR